MDFQSIKTLLKSYGLEADPMVVADIYEALLPDDTAPLGTDEESLLLMLYLCEGSPIELKGTVQHPLGQHPKGSTHKISLSADFSRKLAALIKQDYLSRFDGKTDIDFDNLAKYLELMQGQPKQEGQPKRIGMLEAAQFRSKRGRDGIAPHNKRKGVTAKWLLDTLGRVQGFSTLNIEKQYCLIHDLMTDVSMGVGCEGVVATAKYKPVSDWLNAFDEITNN